MSSRYLKSGHPSHDCDQAWFMFAMKNHRGPGFCRVILVEAKSHAAVAFVERVVSDDNRASATCELLTAHRQCPTIGIRSDMAEEVSFDDFACDIVDREKVDRDPLAMQAYQEAISAVPSPRASSPGGENRALAVAALADLGFKKPQAESMVAKAGPTEGRSLEDIVRAALRASKSPTA